MLRFAFIRTANNFSLEKRYRDNIARFIAMFICSFHRVNCLIRRRMGKNYFSKIFLSEILFNGYFRNRMKFSFAVTVAGCGVKNKSSVL